MILLESSPVFLSPVTEATVAEIIYANMTENEQMAHFIEKMTQLMEEMSYYPTPPYLYKRAICNWSIICIFLWVVFVHGIGAVVNNKASVSTSAASSEAACLTTTNDSSDNNDSSSNSSSDNNDSSSSSGKNGSRSSSDNNDCSMTDSDTDSDDDDEEESDPMGTASTKSNETPDNIDTNDDKNKNNNNNKSVLEEIVLFLYWIHSVVSFCTRIASDTYNDLHKMEQVLKAKHIAEQETQIDAQQQKVFQEKLAKANQVAATLRHEMDSLQQLHQQQEDARLDEMSECLWTALPLWSYVETAERQCLHHHEHCFPHQQQIQILSAATATKKNINNNNKTKWNNNKKKNKKHNN